MKGIIMTTVKKTAKPVKKTTKPVKKTARLQRPKDKDVPKTGPNNWLVETIEQKVKELAEKFGPRPSLTAAQRRRLQGSGIKRYGFIDKTFDVAETILRFAPGTFNRSVLQRHILNIEQLRNIRNAVLQLLDAVDDYLLTEGDNSYRAALIFYNTVRDLARHGDNGASEIFDILRPFFARAGRAVSLEESPTEKQVLRDAKAVLRGTKDGEVVIKGKHRATPPKELEVIDETDKPHGGAKVMERE